MKVHILILFGFFIFTISLQVVAIEPPQAPSCSYLVSETSSQIQAQNRLFYPIIEKFVDSVLSQLSNKQNMDLLISEEFNTWQVSTYRVIGMGHPIMWDHNARKAFQTPVAELNAQPSMPEGRVTSYMIRNRERNRAYLGATSQTEVADYFFWRPIESLKKNDLESSITPIGRYSTEHYQTMLVTTGVLIELLKQNSHTLKLPPSPTRPTFIREERPMAFSPLEPHLMAVLEGIVSLNQFIGLLTFDKILGIDSTNLMMYLLKPSLAAGKRSVIGMLTKLLPMGFLGPSILRGYFPSQPFYLENNQLKASESLHKMLTRIQEICHIANKNKEKPDATNEGCPMAHMFQDQSMGAIDLLAKIYLDVYLLVRNQY